MSARNNNDISRITLDMPKVDHRRLKMLAALSDKSLRELILEFIVQGLSQYQEIECPLNHKPNKETIKSIQDSEKEENLVKAKDVKDLFEKLGVKG